MQAAPSYAVPQSAPWVLKPQALKVALGRYRLPSYSRILARLEDTQSRVRVATIWDKVFGDEMPAGYDTFDFECHLVGRVNRELFPVDMAAMDDVLQSGGDPLRDGIYIEGFGIPWEVCCFADLHRAVVPVLCTLGLTEELDVSGWGAAGFRDGVLDWWEDQVYDWPEWGVGTIADLQDELRGLDEPLDALADVITVIRKDSGYLFLDACNAYWQQEYNTAADIYCWCPECVKALAKEFDRVRNTAERLERYYEWYENEYPASKAQVLEVLLTAARGGSDRND